MIKKKTDNKKTAVYPGTFDPPTYGHLDVIKRAANIFDRVIVAVADRTSKKTLFTKEERVGMLRKITTDLQNVEIDHFNQLLVDFLRIKKASVIVRGLRVLSDFEYEFQMALTNREIAPEIETVFMMTHENYSYISSTLIKEIASLNGNVKKFVHPFVLGELKKKYGD